MTRNITLSVEDTILDAVKVVAAERRTSVNAMVRAYLEQVARSRSAKDEAREALLRLAREPEGDMGRQAWKREALYDR
jgi:hypothetical protein